MIVKIKANKTIHTYRIHSKTPPSVEFSWSQEECSTQPFNLAATLASGQNFRWRKDRTNIWWGCIESTVVAAWQLEGQPDSPFFWQTFPRSNQTSLIRDYFRLDVDLPRLYAEWSRGDSAIHNAVARFRGLRLLRQPPQECLFAFQCATCNTVVKIERSVAYLSRHYGELIDTGLASGPNWLDSPPHPSFYAFPTIEVLAQADEKILRDGLWGYRASRVIALAKHLQTLPDNWLIALRHQPYTQAHAALSSLYGIGAKLADCICLFSLDKDQAVPVDTHIRQIAVNLFAPDMAGKSLTPRVYNALSDAYRSRFGAYAGWAQQYLFFAELQRAPDFACD